MKPMQAYLLSIIVPVFNEEQLIGESVKRLVSAAAKLGCRDELLFVNDRRRDATLALLKKERQSNPNIRILNFTRNFGHQMAITAGMDPVKGDVIVTIDAGLQDPPELMGEMLKKWQEGCDIVYAQRNHRVGETFFKKWTALLFYRLVQKVANVSIPVDVGDYRLMSRRALESLKQLKERHRYVRGLVAWLGYQQGFVSYTREKRLAGTTKYSLWKMMRFSFDGLSSFSNAPLRLATFSGLLCAAFSFLYILYALYIKLFHHDAVRGWTTVIIAVFFLGGVQLICLGIMGEYIGMIHDESKQRPLYLIDDIE